ncbi:MAG TPA: LysR family transcriptional regulator [Paracoccus sp. (in: a-proteobacteria)]|uniref:LysR family transcriptional regulator n=1 Tax=Paracoccus sp. TaxID=267 RepID=UPI002BA92485|nr:LysR family transcriptional regulator [Paracoccus sp. (in: a-proteobacteria)]HWL58261.1 LysR family transcriptional regulator [Paracoccus sp. (in: a-proteobacteria)]
MGLPGDIVRATPATDPGRLMLHGRALRYIDEVARQGSIRKAARVLNVSPSAVNRFVLEMEADLGAPIFERLPKGLKLTTSGEMLVTHIRETLRAHDRMRAQIKALKGLGRGEVTIATMQTLAAGRLAEVVADFRDAHPQINLCVMVGNRPEVINWIASGQAELALAYNLPQDARLHLAAEFRHALGAVVARNHPLTIKSSVRLSDCLMYPLVLADPSLSLREVVQNLAPAGVTLKPVVETNSTEMMKRLVRRPPHVTILNRVDVDQELRDGDLAFLPLEAAAGRQRLILAHRARGQLSPAGSRFLQMAQRMFASDPDRS